MTDRLTEIKARVALWRSMHVSNEMLSDLEFTLAENKRLKGEIVIEREYYDLICEQVNGLVLQRDRLRAALLGLLTFRTNKDFWDRFSDEQLKPLLDDAFAKARAALEDGK